MYRKTNLTYRFYYLASILVLSLFVGCAATKPNLSIIDTKYVPPKKIEKDKNFLTTKSLLAELSLKNHLLAKELGKLPELQDGISFPEVSALEQVIEIYNDIPEEFNDAFDKMYQVGKLDVRKYCSPLQALFWLVEDGKIKKAKGILGDYSLEKLLSLSWPVGPGHLSYGQISDIIAGVKSTEDRKGYEKALSNFSYSRFQEMVFSDYYGYPEMFSQKALNIIKEASEPTEDPRWNDFDTVSDRLNAPELFDYYANTAISYGEIIIGYTKPAKKTFKDKVGDCSDVVELGKTFLDRGGYNVIKICRPNHVMGYIKEENIYWVVIDFRGSGNNLSGPSKDLNKLVNRLGVGSLIPCPPGV